jgi:hypothetical protein
VGDDFRICDHAHERHNGGDARHFEDGGKEHERSQSPQGLAVGGRQEMVGPDDGFHDRPFRRRAFFREVQILCPVVPLCL